MDLSNQQGDHGPSSTPVNAQRRAMYVKDAHMARQDMSFGMASEIPIRHCAPPASTPSIYLLIIIISFKPSVVSSTIS